MVIIIETIFLISLSYITINLYFNYNYTKNIIKLSIDWLIDLLRMISIVSGEFSTLIIRTSQNFGEVFNNRELAIGFWLITIIIFSLWKKEIRKQVFVMVKIIFSKTLWTWYITMGVYFSLMLFFLAKIGYWEIKLLKGTIIWMIFVGITSSIRAVGKAKDTTYFVNLIKDNVKLFIIFQFIVNLYSFSLFLEIILVFVITFLSILRTFMDMRPEYQDKNFDIVKKFLGICLSIIGFYLLFHSCRMLILNLDNIVFIDKIKDMLLPSILSLLFIFYIYFLVLYSIYEQVFIRLNFNTKIEDKLRYKLKFRIFLFCNININRISNFVQRSGVMSTLIESKEDIKSLLSNYKNFK